jgi:hypothetical protein
MLQKENMQGKGFEPEKLARNTRNMSLERKELLFGLEFSRRGRHQNYTPPFFV